MIDTGKVEIGTIYVSFPEIEMKGMNKNFDPEIIIDEVTGCQYYTKPLAFKNGVLYIELMLSGDKTSDQSHRKLAVRAAKHYKSAAFGFDNAVAAKVTVLNASSGSGHPEERSVRPVVETIVGIMFQEGILN